MDKFPAASYEYPELVIRLFAALKVNGDDGHGEIARNSVESQRPSTVTGYAAATPLASGFLETALVKKAMSNGISR